MKLGTLQQSLQGLKHRNTLETELGTAPVTSFGVISTQLSWQSNFSNKVLFAWRVLCLVTSILTRPLSLLLLLFQEMFFACMSCTQTVFTVTQGVTTLHPTLFLSVSLFLLSLSHTRTPVGNPYEQTDLMVFPVRKRIHWGIGRFCFCFFPRILLTLNVL